MTATFKAGQKTKPPLIQPKLKVSKPGDAYEREADAMADRVTGHSVGAMTGPSSGMIGPSIQRKCAHCEEEEKKGKGLMRKGEGAGGQTASAGLVSKLGASKGGGMPLPGNTRSVMESAFSRDFSGVRVHTDNEAAAMSHSIQAKAFTYGNDLYFNNGRYQPHTPEGQKLLAHELTHVVQQRGEYLQRDPEDMELIDIDIIVSDPAEAERLKKEQGITLPAVENIVHLGLSPELIERLKKVLTQHGITPAAGVGAVVQGSTFVLHDTAVNMGSTAIANAVKNARGPLGAGPAAYVPGTGNASVARPDFFAKRRPTATEYEKGNDVLSQPERLKQARTIWQNASSTARDTGLQNAVAGLGLTAAEIKSEQDAAKKQLNAAVTSTSLVYSTGMWAVDEICNLIKTTSIAAVASAPANEAALKAAYDIMQPFFATRNQRIASSVNVEIVQDRGGDCNPNSDKVLPAYTTTQYDNVALLYLQATLQAGQFPEITTHFKVDKGAGDHCDPRCFNVNSLYSNIAGLIGFPASTKFGITPQYGSKAADNVWWSDKVCGGPHP